MSPFCLPKPDLDDSPRSPSEVETFSLAPSLSSATMVNTPMSKSASESSSPLTIARLHRPARISSDGETTLGEHSGYFDMAGPVSIEKRPPVVSRLLTRLCRFFVRSTGDHNIPYLSLLLLRLTEAVPGARYILHPRLIAFAGALAIVLFSILHTTLHKLVLADTLKFEHPFFMHILVIAMSAVVIEVCSGSWAWFARSSPPRTARVGGLAVVYVGAQVLGLVARNSSSVHGSYQVVMALLPVSVAVFSRRNAHNKRQKSVIGGFRRMFDWLTSICRTPTMSSRMTFEDGPSSSGYNSSSSSSSSSSSEYRSASTRRRTGGGSMAATPHKRSFEWLTLFICLSTALSLWSPAFSMVYYEANTAHNNFVFGTIVWARSLVTSLLSLASLVLNTAFLVGTDRYLDQHPELSPVGFLRHFSPLCALLMLVVWPFVESPVDVLETLNSGALLAALGVAALGMLSFVIRVAMMRLQVIGGPAGVCMVENIKVMICLGIGWWLYGYLYWSVQVVGFAMACLGLVCWAVARLFGKYRDLAPVISPRTFSPVRKYDSAVV
ncbi:hypothetical protein GGI15_001136 [Coemansia interrupta]|uniref:Uncharacterized protein n=1 Tax=Coemansia interrupta TaxID=1126814 RepID=A0A9W8HK43_9FUNG|nr:hypothetical protein GGI15_001136 [Coemansia interrupta]